MLELHHSSRLPPALHQCSADCIRSKIQGLPLLVFFRKQSVCASADLMLESDYQMSCGLLMPA